MALHAFECVQHKKGGQKSKVITELLVEGIENAIHNNLIILKQNWYCLEDSPRLNKIEILDHGE